MLYLAGDDAANLDGEIDAFLVAARIFTFPDLFAALLSARGWIWCAYPFIRRFERRELPSM